jgi:hypothetical protein
MASEKTWFPPMEMTEEQQLQSLQAEMDRLTQLENQYRQQQDLVAFGVNEKEAMDIPLTQRVAVKALGTNAEQAAKYLKSKNPGMDFVVQDGEIYGKKMGEKGAYKALDPSSLELADIADLAYDIPAGFVQGAATTAAALPGIALLNPPIALAGASAGSAASGAALEGFRQMLGKSLGVAEEFYPGQTAAAAGIGLLAPGVSQLIAKGGKAAVPAIKKGVGRLMGMSKSEAQAMLENPNLFETAKQAFQGNASAAVETQAATKAAFSNLVEDLKQVGLSENEALNLSLAGTNVDVDMNSVRSAFSQITDKRARAKAAELLLKARQYQVAQRPFEPEMVTQEARQLGVEGLAQPSRIIPSEAVATEAVPEQMAFFEAEQVMKPEYKKIPQPPKAPSLELLESEKLVAPTEEDLANYYLWKESYDAMADRAKNPRTYRYLKDIKDMPVPPQEELLQTRIVAKTPEEELADLSRFMRAEEAIKNYEAKFPQLKQAKAPELMLPPTPATEKIPASITPAYSEFFPAEASQFSSIVQEPLELAGKKGIPATLAREIRQRLQKEARYSAQGTPAKRVFSDEADIINAALRKTSGLQEKEAAMGAGKDLQKRIRAMAMAKKPISAMTSAIEDVDLKAILEEAATRAAASKRDGKQSFKQIQATLGAAKKAAQAETQSSNFSKADAAKAGLAALAGKHYAGDIGAAVSAIASLAATPNVYSKAVPAAEMIEAGLGKMSSMTSPYTKKLPDYSTLPLWMNMTKNKKGDKK